MVAGECGVGVWEDLSDPEKFGKMLNGLLHDHERLSELKGHYENCRYKFSYESQRAAFEEILKKNGLLDFM